MNKEYRDKKGKIRCNFTDNVVEYIVKCSDEIEEYLIESEVDTSTSKSILFNKVNKIFTSNFAFDSTGYFGICPHLDDEDKNEYSIFRIHWCYNITNENICNQCSVNYREWNYTCCLSEKCVYGILINMFDSLTNIYIRDGKNEPIPREWIISICTNEYHRTGEIVELQMDMYYKDKIPEMFTKIN